MNHFQRPSTATPLSRVLKVAPEVAPVKPPGLLGNQVLVVTDAGNPTSSGQRAQLATPEAQAASSS